MEPPENIGFRCKHHKSKPDPRYLDMPFEWFVGRHCKLAFKAGRRTELMWVKVEKVEIIDRKTMLVGYLDNDPVLVTDYKYLDGVGFERHEIHAVDGEEPNFPVPREPNHGRQRRKNLTTGTAGGEVAPAAKGRKRNHSEPEGAAKSPKKPRRRLP